MKKAHTTSRTKTSPSTPAGGQGGGRHADPRHAHAPQNAHRTPVRAGAAPPPPPPAPRANHPEDAASDDRYVRSLVDNAGNSALARHRERVTGTESEEDGVPEDEDAMEDAGQAEIDDDAQGGLGAHR